MKIKIEKAENGFSVRTEGNLYVFSDIQSLLRFLLGEIGPSTSRYDSERVYVVLAPGDKHENFTEEHGNILFD